MVDIPTILLEAVVVTVFGRTTGVDIVDATAAQVRSGSVVSLAVGANSN
jgi:hypothetical protein